jgi:protein ImuA
MPEFAALSVESQRAAVIRDLRRVLRTAEGVSKTLPLGIAAVEACLPGGGLACGALHEVVPETQAAFPAAFGFIVALLARLFSPSPGEERPGVGVGRFGNSVDAPASPRDTPPFPPLLFVLPRDGSRHYGRVSGHGVHRLGLDPARLILVETRHRKETLWALAEALRSAAPQAVAGMIDRLDLKTSQKLHLAATDCGLPLLLLRPAQTLEASAAATRWRVGTAAAVRDRFGLIARPRWHLHLERCRNGRPGEWVVEYDHVAHRFSLAATLADPALFRRAGDQPARQARRS